MKFLIDNKIISKYPRKDIKEPIDGREGKVYIIIDDIPNYNELSQRIIKKNIDETNEIYNDHEHILIAYQRYEVIDWHDEISINNLQIKFGQWIDENYPLWKRQKHLTEILQGTFDLQRKSYIDGWIQWEFEQREKLEQKINNKDYIFDFETKI